MSHVLQISVRFVHPTPTFHGKRDGDEPEWPPSPLRIFQALVDAAANRWRGPDFIGNAKPALEWLQELRPEIVAPPYHVGTPFRLSVPNNDLDSPASVWARGAEASKPHRPVDLRTMKTVQPVHVQIGTGKGEDAIHFLYPLPSGGCPHFKVLKSAARSVTHLGWGIDMVTADADVITEADAAGLPGHRWHVVAVGGVPLRAPKVGTLDDLARKHAAFLVRLSAGGFKPVPPLSAFRVVGYRRATDPASRQFAAFSILRPDASGMKFFGAVRWTRDVAGMVRHAVAQTAISQGWSNERVNVFVHGKTPDGAHAARGDKSPDRFHYLPLPTINHALGRVESIRRVLIAAPPHCQEQIAWVRRTLSGGELMNENGEPVALVTVLAGSDWVLKQYVRNAASWSTVTPVILPGYDDRDADKAFNLLKIAFVQAGYARELVEQSQIEFRGVGFRAGVDLASRYLPPANLENKPRYHVFVRFPHPVPGPVVVGSGRFRGFGLMAAAEWA